MSRLGSLTSTDKKKLALLILWLIAGIGMVVIGIFAFINRQQTVDAVSGVLGVCALITCAVTAGIRFSQAKLMGGSKFTLDWLLWLAIALLLFNTRILQKIGSFTFIIIGIVVACEGVRAFVYAFKNSDDKQWYVPRMIFSIIITILGVVVVFNSEKIFKGMTVLAVGIFFIVHGLNILNDWIGRAKYFHYFRGTEE